MKLDLRKNWRILLGAFFLIFAALIYAGFRYRGHVSSAFGWISQETGGKSMAVLTIVFTLIGLIYAVFCLVFPILVFFKLNDLRRRISQLGNNVEALRPHDAQVKLREGRDALGK